MFAKLTACKEQEKRYKKIVDNPMLYLEECQHQILPEEHQPEINSLRFFGPGAEGAAIEVLALIDWAAENVEISRSPVPEILGFLRRPFVKEKLVKHPILDDPAESIHREKCIQTKAQKAWTYLCALLQFWTDEATTESGKVLYGGQHRPANPMIARIRATLNLSFGDHFKITWASITVSTAWTQSHLFYGETDRERFQTEAGQTKDLQNPLEAAVKERWERYLKEGVSETTDLSFSTPSWAGEASRPHLPSRQPEAWHPTEADSMLPRFTRINRKFSEEQEATTKYETPADSQKQSIDEELGIQDVTDINEIGTPCQNQNWPPPSRTFWTPYEWKWMIHWKSGRIRCLMWKPQMCWAQIQDQALLFQPPKTVSLTSPMDSPGLQGMEDQPPDLWSVPPAEGIMGCTTEG